jgi:hypothetical protein
VHPGERLTTTRPRSTATTCSYVARKLEQSALAPLGSDTQLLRPTPGAPAGHSIVRFSAGTGRSGAASNRESAPGVDPLRREAAQSYRRGSSSVRAPIQDRRPADRALAHVGCRARSCRDWNVRPGAPFREDRDGLQLRGCAQPGGTSGPTEGQRPSGTDADSRSGCLSAVASVQ